MAMTKESHIADYNQGALLAGFHQAYKGELGVIDEIWETQVQILDLRS